MTIILAYDFEKAKRKWHEILLADPNVSIYKKDWFWDAVCEKPDDWRVIIYEGKDATVVFPFLYRRVYGMWHIELPWQVARSGFYMSLPENASTEKKIRLMNEVISYIKDRLPKYDYFNIKFDVDMDNWSPFYWMGFRCSVNYTYTIGERNVDDIKNTFSRRRRQKVNAGQKEYEIKTNCLDAAGIWDFYKSAYIKWDREISFTKERFIKLMDALKEHESMVIKSAHAGDEMVAVEVALLDGNCVHHQFCTNLPEHPNAQTLLTYDTMCNAIDEGKIFDFEGSMEKGPAEFYLSFHPDTELCYCICDKSIKYVVCTEIRRIIILLKKSIAKRLFTRGGYNYVEAKERWRKICEVESSVPIYFKDWYWDATCDDADDWWVILVENDNELEAAFPFVYQKRKGLYYIETPWQVAAAGLYIRKQDTSLGELTGYVNRIIDLIPKYDRFNMVFSGGLWTWQPFYWKGFRATPRYTMCVKADSSDDVLGSITRDRRKRVIRGKKRYRIETDKISFEQYWEFLVSSYKDRGRNLNYERQRFHKLFNSLVKHNACQIRAVFDKDVIVAVNIMLVDDWRYYHQFGTQMKNADPNANSYAIYDAICSAVDSGRVFDFEGSMIQGVCEFNSSFNPIWETEYQIENYSSRYIVVESLRKAIALIKTIA